MRAYMVWRDPQALRRALCRRDPIGVDAAGHSTGKEERRHMTRKQRRLSLIAAGVGVLGIAVGLVLFALRGAIVFFNSPTDLVEKHVAPGTRIRLGGLVVVGSVVHANNLLVRFAVSDGAHSLPVSCANQCAAELPDLFREGQGVVTE